MGGLTEVSLKIGESFLSWGCIWRQPWGRGSQSRGEEELAGACARVWVGVVSAIAHRLVFKGVTGEAGVSCERFIRGCPMNLNTQCQSVDQGSGLPHSW